MTVAAFIRFLATIAWLLVVASIFFAVFRSRNGGRFGSFGMVIGAVILALGLTVAGASIVSVEPNERGVVINYLADNAVRDEPLNPGLSFVLPFFERVVKYPISKSEYTMSGSAGEGQIEGNDSVAARTADGQEVFIDATVIFAVDPTQVVDVHINWQSNYTAGLVRPAVRGVIRDVVSQFGVADVYSVRRNELSEEIQTELAAILLENGLVLDRFLLRNITFTAEYAASIEQKQVAEQEAERAQFVVEQRRQEADQRRAEAQGLADAAVIEAEGRAKARIIEAEAEASALEQIGAALESNPDLLQYEYVEQLGDNVEVMLVPANSPYLFQLPEGSTLPTGGSGGNN